MGSLPETLIDLKELFFFFKVPFATDDKNSLRYMFMCMNIYGNPRVNVSKTCRKQVKNLLKTSSSCYMQSALSCQRILKCVLFIKCLTTAISFIE